MPVQRALTAALSAALLLSSALRPIPAEARGGGGFGGGRGFAGGGFGGGGYHWSGGGDRDVNADRTVDRNVSGGGDWRSGYQGYHPMYGAGSRTTVGNDDFNRNVNVNNNFYNRDYNGWNANWRNGGYWNSRPWTSGWYGGWGGWGWWGANAAAWGVAGLATGAVIGGLVNAASAQQSPVFLVPNTSYQLNYGSVEAVGSTGVSFFYGVNGTQLLGAANCQQGLLNGQIPTDADQAQLLNAVCQVAYGSGS
jgi:hypothetical protein